MQDTPEGQTQSWATLDDEVLGRLDLEGGWLTSHALLQRCDLARDSDQLGECLSRLHRKAKLQRVHGDVGLLYGPLGIDPPSRTVTTGAPKLPTLHDLNRQAATAHNVKIAAGATGVEDDAAQPVIDPLVVVAATHTVPEPAAAIPPPVSTALATGRNMTAALARKTVLDMIGRAGRVRTLEVRAVLGLSEKGTQYHLGLLQKAGEIERIGKTVGAYYVLAQPQTPEPAATSQHESKLQPEPGAPLSSKGSILVVKRACSAQVILVARVNCGIVLFHDFI